LRGAGGCHAQVSVRRDPLATIRSVRSCCHPACPRGRSQVIAVVPRETGVARTQAIPLRRVRALALPPVALWPAIALLALYAAFYVQASAHLVAFPFDFDQGEGY